MSLIETIDLRYVKEEADFGTGSALECRFAFSLGEVLNKRWCEHAFAATTREKPVSRFAKRNGTSQGAQHCLWMRQHHLCGNNLACCYFSTEIGEHFVSRPVDRAMNDSHE